jgi:Domain of unknown function (DUF4396)
MSHQQHDDPTTQQAESSVAGSAHPAHRDAEEHAHGSDSLWSTAVMATLHCLTGCAIGEVLGMVIATALGWGNIASIWLAVALAFAFGYGLTMRSVLGHGLDTRQAIRVALAADTVSILTMEIVDNGFILAVPGALDAGLGDALFWISLAASLAIAFALTVPVNRWMIARGRGHAVVHSMH